MTFELTDIKNKAMEICYKQHCRQCPKQAQCMEECNECECANYNNIESSLMKCE